MEYIFNICHVLYKRINTTTLFKYNDTDKKIMFFNTRHYLINVFEYFNFYNLCKKIDIDKTKKINIFYEDSTLKFITITFGNIKELRQKIFELKSHNTNYFISPDLLNNEYIIKDMYVVNNNGIKTDIKKIFNKYVEYDYPIKMSDIIKNNDVLEINYYFNFKLLHKKINISEIIDLQMNDIYTILK